MIAAAGGSLALRVQKGPLLEHNRWIILYGVITHRGVAGDIDREDPGELLDPLGDPRSTVS